MQWPEILIEIFAVLGTIAGGLAVAAALYRRKRLEKVTKALLDQMTQSEAKRAKLLEATAALDDAFSKLDKLVKERPAVAQTVIKGTDLLKSFKKAQTELEEAEKLLTGLRELDAPKDWNGYDKFQQYLKNGSVIYEKISGQLQRIADRLGQISHEPSTPPGGD